jgi:hypothetical protein
MEAIHVKDALVPVKHGMTVPEERIIAMHLEWLPIEQLVAFS